MVDLRIEKRGITSPDVQPIQQSSQPLQALGAVAESAANDANQLQQSSEKLYVARFQETARENIDAISEANKSNPDQLKKELDSFYNGFTKDTPFQLKPYIKEQFNVMSRPAINNAVKLRTQINNDALKETHLKNITEAFKTLESNAAGMLSGDPHMAYDASRSVQMQMMSITESLNQLTEDGTPLFNAETRVKMLENAQQQLVESGVRSWYDQQSDKLKAYQDFMGGKKNFTFYDAEGNPEVKLDPLFEMNRGTFEKTRSYMEASLKQAMQQMQTQISLENFENLLNDGQLLIDPKDKQQRALADLYFDEKVAPATQGMNPEQQIETFVGYVNKVGILPSKLNSQIRATLRNGSVDNRIFAAQLINRLEEDKPQALAEIDGKDRTFGTLLAANLRAGNTPEDAVKQTILSFNPENQKIFEQRKKDASEVNINYERELTDVHADRPWYNLWFNRRSLPEQINEREKLESEFKHLFEDQYVLSGDKDVALTRAKNIMKQQTGVTTIGRERMMKYPPENFYAIQGIDNDWMERQLIDDIKKQTGDQNVSMSNVTISADYTTRREALSGQLPSYVVSKIDENGEFVPYKFRYKFNPEPIIKEKNEEIRQLKNEKVKDLAELRQRSVYFEQAIKKDALGELSSALGGVL